VLNVFPDPAPVNDATTTVQGSPVVADVSINDGGTTGGTYSIIAQSAGGTFTMNPSTGQYTFTPTSTFTGVATATYNLCNGAPVTCSTAVITVTVFPTLVANSDVINTSPGSTTTGGLLGNDSGVVPGGNYTVSATPLPSSTGTLLVNPATGQYTFIPNPSFTGTASTTYTVCNTSVNPQVCSTNTIVINVFPDPAPVNDTTVTVSGSPVSGSLATNDGGVTGGTFSIVTQPTGGTVTVNPITGQYTFTPAPSFTGVTTATYVLCNGAPVTCSTAVLTITVYPVLQAVTDVTNTAINSPVSGTLTTNDTGIVPNGNYTISASPLPSGTGTLVVNPNTGQYTFTPATGFTGTVVSTYTICQLQGTVNLQCSTATLIINVGAISKIGLAKTIASVTYNSDGTATINYKITVKNMGNQPLTNVSVSDDLGAAYPSPASYTVNSTPSVISGTTQLTMEAGFNGSANKLLTVPLSSSLAVGKSDTINLSVRVRPGSANGSYQNSATVTAVGSGTNVSDESVDGLNPDPDNDGNANNNSGASTFTFSVPKIGLAKLAGTSVSQGAGCYDVVFRFAVKNYGTQPAYQITLREQLDQAFANALSYSVVGTPTCVNGLLQANNLFTGTGTQTNLVASTSSLQGGASDTVLLKVNYCITGTVTFTNTAKVTASSLPTGGFVGEDVSTDGTNPDPNGDGTPNESTPTVFAPVTDLFVPDGFSPNNDGVNDLFVIRGLQDYPENEVSIINRWGNVVYRKKQYDNTWDGTSNQGISYGGHELPEGTYFYIVEPGNGRKALKGYLYLNRTVK
jgi:gliding motility-associated-like protein